MTVREYIGARYVPLFIGQWSNEVTYEPLSIVTYEGNSYTSRQYVPIGVDIENESFWALTGNYNAQVEAYREEVLQFDNRITANEDAIEDIEETLGNLNISSLDLLVKLARSNSNPNPYLFHCFYSYYKNNVHLKYMENNKTDGTATRYVKNGNLIEPATLNLSANGRYYIDCNTLVQLILMGVPYEASRYAGNQSNYVKEPYSIPFENANDFAIQYYTFQDNENLKGLMESDIGIGRWAANQMAYFFYQNSQLTEVKNYKQLQFGDIVFQQTTPDYGEDYGYWRGITHVGMFLGRSGNVIYVGECHEAENEAMDNGPIFIRPYPLSYFEGTNIQNAFTYFYRPNANPPALQQSAISPTTFSYAQQVINTATSLHTFNCNIKNDEIIFVEVDCEATNVYMTFVNAEDTTKGLTMRTDLGVRSGIIVNCGDISKLRIYAIPLGDTGGGNFKLNGISIVKYDNINAIPIDYMKAFNASSAVTSLAELKTLIDNLVIYSGAPKTFDIYLDYATSQSIEGLNSHIGVTMIHVNANSGASYNATAVVQNGTTIYRVQMARSGSTYSNWADVS